MIPLTALWLPILLSAVIVFFASFIMHMLLAYHKSDYRKLPDEDCVTDTLRSAGVTRGPAYFFPYFSFRVIGTVAFLGCTVRRREWSDRESRHGRHSREGSGRGLRELTEIQLYGGRPRVFSSV